MTRESVSAVVAGMVEAVGWEMMKNGMEVVSQVKVEKAALAFAAACTQLADRE